MLDMKNTFLSSPSSQFYATGNTDFQMLKRNVLPEMDHNLGFCMVKQLIHEDFAHTYDQFAFTSNCDSVGVKRRKGSGKRSKTTSFEEHSHPRPQDTTKVIRHNFFLSGSDIHVGHTSLPLPTSRSQKLGDKITVLQKLVSPYGKTNTAAVLEEARLYIKLLQQQIETLSSSYNTSTETQSQDDEERPTDLRSRGLCLVPVSFSGKVTADKDSTDFLEKIKVPRNFN